VHEVNLEDAGIEQGQRKKQSAGVKGEKYPLVRVKHYVAHCAKGSPPGCSGKRDRISAPQTEKGRFTVGKEQFLQFNGIDHDPILGRRYLDHS
jgi:hypothetical protein